MPEASPGRTLHLRDIHASLGAQFGSFAGWEMPLWYDGAIAEHTAVRESAGLFDISHMGRFRVEGPEAANALVSVLTREPGRLSVNKSAYCLCCNETGGIIDDLIVYRRAEQSFVVICNAANAARILSIVRATLDGRNASVEDLQPGTVLLAIQGPAALAQSAHVLGDWTSAIPRRGLAEGNFEGESVFCARGGYTGEDGFEIIAPAGAGRAMLRRLIDEEGCKPCGLAARDSLRLEASLPLHGSDIDETTTPWEAGLAWSVDLDHDFTGRAALETTKGAQTRRLCCLESEGAGVLRHGQDIYDGSEKISSLTSGGFAPTLGKSIALAYLPLAIAQVDKTVAVDVRGRMVPVRLVKRPFYTSPDLAQKR